MTESESSAREAMEKSRLAVSECEEEIKSIKNALKSLTMGTTSADSTANSLEVSVHKVKVVDNHEAPTTFKIHLSSPIEVRTITQLFDPLNPTAEESLAKFESVEISNALLTVETYSDDGVRKLGVSATHDLLPLCQDMELWKKGGEKKSSSLEMAIVAEVGIDDVDDVVIATDKNESESWEDAVTELAEGEIEEGSTYIGEVEEKGSETLEKNAEESPKTNVQVPLYTIVIQLEYRPSPEDRRDALYEKLNEVSKRKVAAIESLRKSAVIANRARAAEGDSTTGGESDRGGPAVKSGFLNKVKVQEEKSIPFWKRWYENTIGPQSMLWVLGPAAKNYIIFVGVSLFIHYKGDLLALPPPV